MRHPPKSAADERDQHYSGGDQGHEACLDPIAPLGAAAILTGRATDRERVAIAGGSSS